MIYLLLLGGLFFALSCGIMANRKNRQIILCAMLGGVGGILTYVLLACMPYLCPFCHNNFSKNADGEACGSCGQLDKLTEDDLLQLKGLEEGFRHKGWQLKVDGVILTLVQSTGAKLKFVGVKQLQDYINGKE